MKAILGWMKSNKLTTLLILIILYFVFQSYSPIRPSMLKLDRPMTDYQGPLFEESAMKYGAPTLGKFIPPNPGDYTPTENQNRLVIQNADMSLQVKNVRSTVDDILNQVKAVGGFMINSTLSSAEDAPNANLTVRVPSDKFPQVLNFLRKSSIKVVYENLFGEDVTDQYEDINAKLTTLNKTKAKFEEIFNSAAEVSDILNIQQQIINIESQIDSYIGRQQYLEKNAQLARITINLSTDEFSLQYASSETWRPEVIFKQAVRSLVGLLRKLATAVIWLTVYSIVIIPVILVLRYFLRNKELKK